MTSNPSIQPSAGTQAIGITIVAEDLGKRFNREWIFKDLSFTFSPGNTYAVVGPNGSGKSTLLQVLCGQLPQTTGVLHYRASGNDIPAEDIYRHISIAAPYMELIEEFTVDEHIRFHFGLKKMRNGVDTDQFLETIYFTEARDKKIGNFSSGMKQRLKLALALYTQADIIFLDEPGTNLDARAFAWYWDQLQKVPSASMIFIASNNPREYPENAKIVDLMQYKMYKQTNLASKF